MLSSNKRKEGIKTLLVYTNSSMDNLIPIGISLLSACLKNAGHKVKLFDTTLYKTSPDSGDDSRIRTLQVPKTKLEDLGISYKKTDYINDLEKLVDEYKPDLVGVSCTEPSIWIGLKLLNAIKDYPKIVKAVGGIGITFYPEIIKNECVDLICIGEGEEVLVELADRIRDRKDYSSIKNLWVKKDGRIIKNLPRPLIDINKLPYPDWEIYEKNRFYKPMGGKVKITGTIEAQRGCPHNCSYCNNYGLNKMFEGYLRRKNTDRLIAEVKYMKEKYKLEYIYFYGENFLSMPREDFDKFIEKWKEEIDIPFWVETRPETINEKTLKKMKGARCEGISMGIEHGNEEFRRKVLNRYVTNKGLIRSFKLAGESGIRISANNIIGFPDETRELVFDTIELNRKLNVNNVMVNILNPYRGTKIYDICIEKGYLKETDLAKDFTRSEVILNLPTISKEEIKGLHRTFVLYTKMPKSKWPLIKRAEKFDEEGNRIFAELTKEFYEGGYL